MLHCVWITSWWEASREYRAGMDRHVGGRDAGPPQYRITQRSTEDVTRKMLQQRQSDAGMKIQNHHGRHPAPASLVITPRPSHPSSVTFARPPGHPSQKRLTHRRSRTREIASTARSTDAKRDDGGGHHDDGPTMVVAIGRGGTNRLDGSDNFN